MKMHTAAQLVLLAALLTVNGTATAVYFLLAAGMDPGTAAVAAALLSVFWVAWFSALGNFIQGQRATDPHARSKSSRLTTASAAAKAPRDDSAS